MLGACYPKHLCWDRQLPYHLFTERLTMWGLLGAGRDLFHVALSKPKASSSVSTGLYNPKLLVYQYQHSLNVSAGVTYLCLCSSRVLVLEFPLLPCESAVFLNLCYILHPNSRFFCVLRLQYCWKYKSCHDWESVASWPCPVLEFILLFPMSAWTKYELAVSLDMVHWVCNYTPGQQTSGASMPFPGLSLAWCWLRLAPAGLCCQGPSILWIPAYLNYVNFYSFSSVSKSLSSELKLPNWSLVSVYFLDSSFHKGLYPWFESL